MLSISSGAQVSSDFLPVLFIYTLTLIFIKSLLRKTKNRKKKRL